MITGFESFLIDRGYRRFALDCESGKYVDPRPISTMVNLNNRYFHESDSIALDGIKEGRSVFEDFGPELRRSEVVFGLNESGKPTTLTHPRPIIIRQFIFVGELCDAIFTDDDDMNFVLSKIPHEEIFEAMYDRRIKFIIDRTKDHPTIQKIIESYE